MLSRAKLDRQLASELGRKPMYVVNRGIVLSGGHSARPPGRRDAGATRSQFASFAANASTRIPAAIRYTAKGTNPCFRTQPMNHATDA